MRVWVDLTNSPHVLVMRPVIEAFRADGHDVRVTARDFAQTFELLERFEIPYEPIGRHRGERPAAKAVGLLSRSAALTRWARGGRFDLALGHGSNDITVAAALLGVPCSTMFDYEFAALQHHINCRLADAVVVPNAIPAERLYRYGARRKIAAYEGLKEEYYLADFEPNSSVLDELSIEPARALIVVRTPPELALYHRFASDLFRELLTHLQRAAQERGTQVVVLARTAAQRARLSAFEELTLPAHAIDAQSLVAYADLVVSAGGTMNREAAALGTPVVTTFQGRIGGVDERLIREGRLRRIQDGGELASLLEGVTPHRSERAPRTRRDPRLLTELLRAPLATGQGRMSASGAAADTSASRKEMP
jgi:predicted glycosyltransferase